MRRSGAFLKVDRRLMAYGWQLHGARRVDNTFLAVQDDYNYCTYGTVVVVVVYKI